MKLSVIVPVYNVELYIRKCLDSLIIQDFIDVEFLIINDGSPDHSKDIIEEYLLKDSRLKLINKENGGWGTAVKRGIIESSSEYITILDSDDWFVHEDSLTKYIEDIEEHNNPDLYIGNYYKYYSEKDKYSKAIHKPSRWYQQKVSELVELSTVPHSKFYKREMIKDFEFAEKVNHNDNLLYLLSLSKLNTVYLNEKIVESVHWMNRPNNSIATFSQNRFIHELKVRKYILSQLSSNNEVTKKIFENIVILYLISLDYISFDIEKTELLHLLHFFNKEFQEYKFSYCIKKLIKNNRRMFIYNNKLRTSRETINNYYVKDK